MQRCTKCESRAWFQITHKAYGYDRARENEERGGDMTVLSPSFACKRHVTLVLLDSEYSEGDEMVVKRIYFPGA